MITNSSFVVIVKEQGIEPTDFGVGDPTDPTPALIRQACQEAVERHPSVARLVEQIRRAAR